MTITSHADGAAILAATAARFERVTRESLETKPKVRVLLTGGTLGIELLAELAKLDLPWNKIWMMFSDERFVPIDHPDRNEHQALAVWPGLAQWLTRYPQADRDLNAAAAELEALLELELGAVNGEAAVFDITILGMGPDAHVASLFPSHDRLGGWVIAEPESPKPPSQRLSLSYKALKRSERVWFMAAGANKSWAIRQSLEGHSDLPAARVRGRLETHWFVDQEITAAL
jgi:6-phosphogluconolactonase